MKYLIVLLLITGCAPWIVTNVTNHNKGCTYIIGNNKKTKYVDDADCKYQVGDEYEEE